MGARFVFNASVSTPDAIFYGMLWRANPEIFFARRRLTGQGPKLGISSCLVESPAAPMHMFATRLPLRYCSHLRHRARIGLVVDAAASGFDAIVFAILAMLEDATLQHELSGCGEYALRIRPEGIPGIW